MDLCRANGHGFAEDETCYFHLLVREYCSGASPPGGFLWGSAPNPARFFEKSVGKIMFCHTFHEKTGMTLSGYVLEKRLSKAESMLRKGVRPVGEIALALGFSSVSYFCSVFNKKYGMSPLAYRKSAASEADFDKKRKIEENNENNKILINFVAAATENKNIKEYNFIQI